jgi:CPA1 family monovalent cation:H+ antiporter
LNGNFKAYFNNYKFIGFTGLLKYPFSKITFDHWLMVLSLLLSLLLLLVASASTADELIKTLLVQLDFSGFLLDFMLGFLLFAGALHTDINRLRKSRGPIITFATLGILISTVLVAGALYFYFHCFLSLLILFTVCYLVPLFLPPILLPYYQF